MKPQNVLDKIGIPSKIGWGYLGILIFMMGDGIEIGWLSPYLVDRGLTVQLSATLFTAYGVTIAISSWFSGVLVEALGAKKTMLTGLLLYILGTIGFVGFGMPDLSFSTMLVTYAVRGFGYPLFAYSFLVWIAYRSPKEKLSTAAGWFWFFFTGGLNVLGAYYSSWAIIYMGHLNTMWSSLFWVTLGAFFALVLNRDKLERKKDTTAKQKVKELFKGVTIVKREPKVLLGGIVRTINTTSQFAFPVFLPLHMADFGISTTTWLQIWGAIFTSNILFNVCFGVIGDKLGWRNTVIWFGGVSAAISTLLLYYSPEWTNGNIVMITIAGMLWGASLAGYVPLSALVPSLVQEEKGAAISILNLGAGLPVFVGPALVGLLIGTIGSAGVIWVLAILYVISSILTVFITLPESEQPTRQQIDCIRETKA
ncbi:MULTISPECIES: MFS transporter [Bacillus]|uniref:MFS transporter n=1 Tax=Bacillus TaxID=1386 RepID=UPI0004795118|nr:MULTISPECIES: MFS transporter [Bacillus]QHZ48845.1 MFS transporter [Bacillus sp. NSP9.1]WFA05518.1 MFS transporter [Bacillus sp. HSf4]